MTDREKLLKLYNDLKAIAIPEFENSELQILVNTIVEGIKIITDWLVDAAKKHFGNTNR